MSTPVKVEHNVETGEIVEIPLTKKEIAELEKSAEIELNRLTVQEQNELAEKEGRIEILAKLGLTAQEAKLLLS